MYFKKAKVVLFLITSNLFLSLSTADVHTGTELSPLTKEIENANGLKTIDGKLSVLVEQLVNQSEELKTVKNYVQKLEETKSSKTNEMHEKLTEMVAQLTSNSADLVYLKKYLNQMMYSIIQNQKKAEIAWFKTICDPSLGFLHEGSGQQPEIEEVVTEMRGNSNSNSSAFCLPEINKARSGEGRELISNDDLLVAAAKYHNNWMMATNCTAHECPGEKLLGDRVSQTGYRWIQVSENIAAGDINTCEYAVSSWMTSPGHRENILRDTSQVGCSMEFCGNCSYHTYITCVHATPQIQ